MWAQAPDNESHTAEICIKQGEKTVAKHKYGMGWGDVCYFWNSRHSLQNAKWQQRQAQEKVDGHSETLREWIISWYTCKSGWELCLKKWNCFGEKSVTLEERTGEKDKNNHNTMKNSFNIVNICHKPQEFGPNHVYSISRFKNWAPFHYQSYYPSYLSLHLER